MVNRVAGAVCKETRKRARASGPRGGRAGCDGTKGMHLPVSFTLLRARTEVGEGEKRNWALCGAKGCGESEGESGGYARPDANEKQKEPQGRRKGRRLLMMDPVASRDGHRVGQGWRGEGLKLGRMM